MKKLKKIGLWLSIIVLLLILISFLLPGSYHVERTVFIHSPARIPYLLTSDFRLWHTWAPRTKETDSTAEFFIAGEPGKVGSSWGWTGEVFGQGVMIISKLETSREILYNLAFDDSAHMSSGRFLFEETGDSCKVTWTDQGDLGYNPFYRYMGLLMNSMMGPDFETGLAKLKTVSEARAEWPKIEEITWSPQILLTIRDSAGPQTYNAVMGRAFAELMGVVATQKLKVTGAPFATYIRWDSVTMFSVMDIGIPVEKAEKGAGRVNVTTFPAQKVIQAQYFGPYEKTAPVYYIIDQYIRETGLQSVGGPWELYITDPTIEKDTAKWETWIAFPVR
jgi:effector-binding domain-containing protein